MRKKKIQIVKKANQIHQIKMILKNSKTDLQEPIDFLNIESKDLRQCISQRMNQMKSTRMN